MESFHMAFNNRMKGLHNTLTRCGVVYTSELGDLDADKPAECKWRSFRARGWTRALAKTLDRRCSIRKVAQGSGKAGATRLLGFSESSQRRRCMPVKHLAHGRRENAVIQSVPGKKSHYFHKA
jgi:hypothetical protein